MFRHSKFPSIAGVLLAAVIALGIALRFWGIGFGLPNTRCRPDEDVIVGTALRFFSGDLNPHFFNYPTLYMYTLALLYGGFFCLQMIGGSSVAQLMSLVASDRTSFFLISRYASAFCGATTVLVVWWVARRAFDRGTALVAAFFMAACYLHVRDSHFGTTDVAMTMLVLVACLALLRLHERGRRRDYWLAGVGIGLAASTKYGAVLMALPLAAAHLLLLGRKGEASGGAGSAAGPERGPRPVGLFDLWPALAGAAAAFLATTPFALLDLRTFLSDFIFEGQHVASEHGLALGRGWVYHACHTLPLGLGWPMLICALAGGAMAARRSWRTALILFLFPLAFYAVAGKGQTVYVRYMVPIVPFLCLSAAVCVAGAGALVRAERARAPVVAALAILVALPSLGRCVAFDRRLARTDTRLLAAEWFARNAPPGSSIHQTGSEFAHVQLPQALPEPAGNSPGMDAPLARAEEKVQAIRRDQMRANGFHRWGYGLPVVLPDDKRLGRRMKLERTVPAQPGGEEGTNSCFHEILPGFGSQAVPPGELPDFIVMHDSPLKMFTASPETITSLAASRYDLQAMFPARRPRSAAGWYDQLDAFFLPFAGFSGVTCPGPDIAIYRRKSSP